MALLQRALLEFRRKVNKSYRGRSCPIAVHCSDGVGRAGTYILTDMVLNRMSKVGKPLLLPTNCSDRFPPTLCVLCRSFVKNKQSVIPTNNLFLGYSYQFWAY